MKHSCYHGNLWIGERAHGNLISISFRPTGPNPEVVPQHNGAKDRDLIHEIFCFSVATRDHVEVRSTALLSRVQKFSIPLYASREFSVP